MRRLAGVQATFHQTSVPNRCIQPRAKGLGLRDAVDVAVRLEQRVLHDVFGILLMAAHEQAEPIRDLLRLYQQPLDRIRVAGRRLSDQRRILRFGAVPWRAIRPLRIGCGTHAPDCTCDSAVARRRRIAIHECRVFAVRTVSEQISFLVETPIRLYAGHHPTIPVASATTPTSIRTMPSAPGTTPAHPA